MLQSEVRALETSLAALKALVSPQGCGRAAVAQGLIDDDFLKLAGRWATACCFNCPMMVPPQSDGMGLACWLCCSGGGGHAPEPAREGRRLLRGPGRHRLHCRYCHPMKQQQERWSLDRQLMPVLACLCYAGGGR